MAQMHVIDVTGIRHPQQEVGQPGVVGHQLHVLVGFHDGFQLGRAEHVLDTGNGPKKSIHRPRQNKFRSGALGAKIIFEPAFLIIIDACCNLRHGCPRYLRAARPVNRVSVLCYAPSAFLGACSH